MIIIIKKKEIDYELVIDSSNYYTSIYVHLQIDDAILNQVMPVNIEQRVREAISQLYYNTAPGTDTTRRVAINTGKIVNRDFLIGTTNENGLAGAFHLHFMIYKDLDFSETHPFS